MRRISGLIPRSRGGLRNCCYPSLFSNNWAFRNAVRFWTQLRWSNNSERRVKQNHNHAVVGFKGVFGDLRQQTLASLHDLDIWVLAWANVVKLPSVWNADILFRHVTAKNCSPRRFQGITGRGSFVYRISNWM